MKRIAYVSLVGIALTTVVVFQNCSSSGSGSSGGSSPVVVQSASKSLWSLWAYSGAEGSAASIDLTGGAFGISKQFTIYFQQTDGVFYCACDYFIEGTTSKGSYSSSNCVVSQSNNPIPQPSDAQTECDEMNGVGTYTNNGTTLTTCGSGGCTAYQ